MRIPEIKNMTAETVQAVQLLERQCFSVPWSLESLTTELSNPNAVFRTAGINGDIVGYVGMHHIIDEGYITNIAVSPSCRRCGIARVLIKSLLEYGEKNKLCMITLEVRESNHAARSLYRSFEFKEAGKRKNFYDKPVEDGIIMTREL